MTATDDIPPDLLYHPEHDWARIDGQSATFGITQYAQSTLGELVFWDAPSVGATVSQGGEYCELESVKAVSSVIAPLSGEVIEINQQVAKDPAVINADPYGSGWLIKVRITAPAELDALLNAESYRELLSRS